MNLGPLREVFGPQIQEIDDTLGAYLRERAEPRDHYGLIRYHFGFPEHGVRLASGKRMRAIFCLLICRATGAPTAAALTLAVATEMMHGASLIHDDIVDGDTLRWDRQTAWSKYGLNQALNAGDAMINQTYELLLRLGSDGIAPKTVLRILEIFNASFLTMTEGQHMDLRAESRPDTPIDTYLDIIARKTAIACECPSRTSAVLANASPQVEEGFARFGHAFGMLYQVVDDVASVWGNQQTTGKVALRDLILRKSSLPVLYGFRHGSPNLRALLSKRNDVGARSADVEEAEARAIHEELTQLGIQGLCTQHVRHYRDAAISALHSTGSVAPEVAMLENMTVLCAQMAGLEKTT